MVKTFILSLFNFVLSCYYIDYVRNIYQITEKQIIEDFVFNYVNSKLKLFGLKIFWGLFNEISTALRTMCSNVLNSIDAYMYLIVLAINNTQHTHVKLYCMLSQCTCSYYASLTPFPYVTLFNDLTILNLCNSGRYAAFIDMWPYIQFHFTTINSI